LKRYQPRRIIIYSRDELKQHDMRVRFPDRRLSFFIGDVRDVDRLKRAFEANVDYVIHAAALKQIGACEYNPFEAVKTNIHGAQNIINAAIDCRVKRVIALSTDKCVNPTNLYGATKLCAEKLFVQGNSYAGAKNTRFSCVRYGNVVGSRGSVVPLFLEQRKTGRITVTDHRMTRFWITLDQAAEFVITCLDKMQGGEVFIPRIPSTGIMDIVNAVAPNCEVEFMGIRPGEKLHEELLSRHEIRHTITLDKMFVIQPEHQTWGNDPGPLEGETLPDEFEFTSDENEAWLSVDQLREMVKELNNGF
jgi:UDP-N-acetylglucosamine 4,6-dehydratase